MLLQRGLKLPLHGGGGQTRRYLYAGDAANAFNIMLHRGKGGEIYNLGCGPQDELTNKALCGLLLQHVKPPGYEPSNVDAWILSAPDRPFVDRGCGLDCTKLRSLGWEQKVAFDEGLRRTVDWLAAHGESWWGDVGKTLVPEPQPAK